MKTSFKLQPIAALALLLGAVSAHAAPSFSTSVFANAPTGASGPDSVAVGGGSVWIAYDGTALSSDGSQPSGFSTVARYSTAGALQDSYRISGDVDGLKYDPSTGMVWATQNQDANSSVTLIDPVTRSTTALSYASPSTHQGVDDLAFTSTGTYLSTTNPASASDPTLVRVVPGTSPIQVTTIATAGQTGLNINTGATGYVPARINSDSLKVAPNGDLVQTTGNRDTLLFIHNPGLASASFSFLTLTAGGTAVTGLDDSLFLPTSAGTIYASVSKTNQVLAINFSGVTPGTLLASIGSLNEIGTVDLKTGEVTPLVTGLPGIHGMDVMAAVPEPSSYALMLAGMAMVGTRVRRRRSGAV